MILDVLQETGWLGRGWYKAEIVKVKRGPPLKYWVRWTYYGGLKTWVRETHVTPLAVAAFLKKKLSDDKFAEHWERVLILAAKSGDIDKVRYLPDLKRFANCRDEVRVRLCVCVCVWSGRAGERGSVSIPLPIRTCVYVCACVRACVCVHVCMCICTYICT